TNRRSRSTYADLSIFRPFGFRVFVLEMGSAVRCHARTAAPAGLSYSVRNLLLRLHLQEFAMRRKFARKPPPCADVGPGDGLDPRLDEMFTPRRAANRKALQLCAQIAHTLGSVLSGECGDDRLRDLLVESVEPAPDSTRL